MKFPRFMIAAASSGSGKTMITCGILQALKMRGMKVASFKCGPDYIDPMFHSRVIRAKARNLDTYFTSPEMVRYLFTTNAKKVDISVLEGVMGYYDGLGGISTEASAYDLAKVTDTPAILVVNAKGMSMSICAVVKGFLTLLEPSGIAGVILNQMPAMLYPEIKRRIQEELGIPVLGYVPKVEELQIESRHLGLVMPEEIADLEQKLISLAVLLEETLEMDRILALAEEASELEQRMPKNWSELTASKEAEALKSHKPRIAVARDEAFCFIYEDNLKFLEALGAELSYFSPIHDQKLPEGSSGLLLYGGYPELYADELEENKTMRACIYQALKQGMPCMAECGGFLYLHEQMEDMKKKSHSMAGIIPGKAYRTDTLGRFGYIGLTAKDSGILGDGLGEVRGHEFHYFESTHCGVGFQAKKPLGNRSWECIHGSGNSILGFPHLYYPSNPLLALEFLKGCVEYGGRKT